MSVDVLAEYGAWQEFYGYPSDIPSVPFAVGTSRAITFPTTGLVTKCRIALSANLSQDWRSWSWLDISDHVRWQDGVSITTGKRDRDPNVPAGTANFTVENIDGALSRQNVFSPLFGSLFKHNPIWVTTNAGNGEFDEFFGFTQALPKRSDKTGTDGRIHMTCKGPLDHIFRSKGKESPLNIACVNANPTHLWSLEEEPTAVQASSALPNGIAMTQTGTIDWAASSIIIGAKALPNMRSGSGTLVGALDQRIPGGAPGYKFDHNYMVSIITRPEDFASGSFTVFRVSTENQNSISAWELQIINDGTLQLISYDYTNVSTVRSTSAVIPGIFTEPKLLTFTGQLLNDGFNPAPGLAGDSRFRMLVNNVEVTTTTLTQYTGNLLEGTLTASNASESALLGYFMVHHLSFYSFESGQYLQNVDSVPNSAEIIAALTAFTGDMVHERIARVCRNKGIPFYTSAGISQRLGPQPIDTPINIIRNAERVEGVVYEKEFGLAYKSIAEYYRQPVSIALDIAQGHLVGELQPADDTTKFFNQWTVTRQGGSSSTQQKDGGISENEEIFANEQSYNVETDTQAAWLASYFANRDSSEADRWPSIQFYLQKHPELITAYQGMPFGARATVANMKTRWGVTGLDLTVEGKHVFFNSKQYQITLNASDATIYNIGQLDGGQVLDSRSLVLNSSLTATPGLKDTFTRDDPSNWGAPDIGPSWVTSGVGSASVSGGIGRHAIPAANNFLSSSLGISQKNYDFVVDFSFDKVPVGANNEGKVLLRRVDALNYLDVRLFARPTNDFTVAVRQVIAGVETVAGFPTIPGCTATSWVRMRIYVQNEFFGIKAWNRDTAIEPLTWNVKMVTTHIDPGDLIIQTLVGGIANAPIEGRWDNINEPATMDALSLDSTEKISTDATDFPVDVTMLGERLTVTSVSEIAFDLMDRTEVNSWGLASSGHSATIFGGVNTDYAVNGGTGKHTLTSVNVMRHTVYNPVGLNDTEIIADVRINVTPTGGPISCWIATRWLDQSNYYDGLLVFNPNMTAGLTIGVRAGGLHTLIAGQLGILNIGSFTVGNYWRIHFRTVGNSLSAKAWEIATQAEPALFHVNGNATETSGVHPVGGDFAVQSRLEPGNTNVNPVVEWDNVHVLTPQRLVVTRNVNGVERAHPKGRPIRAADPFILGL